MSHVLWIWNSCFTLASIDATIILSSVHAWRQRLRTAFDVAARSTWPLLRQQRAALGGEERFFDRRLAGRTKRCCPQRQRHR